MECENKQTK